MNFIQKLKLIQRKSNSLLCIGLDPDAQKIPKQLRKLRYPLFEFNRRIIDATHDLVCAYKLNLAFYESTGAKGWESIQKTLEYIPKNIITIGDGKRGDISSTAEQQARSLYNVFGFTAVTLNPYMGKDAIEPFTRQKERGVFILAVTSNEGSKDFQRLKVNGKPLYEHVVTSAKKWNVRNNTGLVVGATRPEELRRVRSLAPDMPLLIPGIGAQGGELESTVRYGCDRNGELALINIGRSIIYYSSEKDFAEKARLSALYYHEQMNYYRDKYFS